MEIQKSSVANVLGVVSVILLFFLWAIVLNPFKLNLSFPGGLSGGALTMISAVLLSLFASIFGKRAWFIVLALAILTFVYIGFVNRLPFWY